MTFLNQVALIIKSCFHHGISSVSAKGRKLERQTVLVRFCQERIQTTEGLCKIVLLLILGVISFLMVEQLISIFFLFTIAIYLVLSEGEFKKQIVSAKCFTKLKIFFCTFGSVFMKKNFDDQCFILLSSFAEWPKSENHFCCYWENCTIVLSMVFILSPVSVKNTHEKSSQSTPPCLFGELSSSVNSAGMICHILNR